MHRHLGLVLAAGLAGGSLASQAEAQVTYFYDGFEAQTDPLGNPPTGLAWRDNGLGDNHAIVTSPVATGTQALQLIRSNDGSTPNLRGVSDPGALVAGNTIEVVFHIDQQALTGEPSHAFNGPIQIGVGFSNGQNLLRFGTLDANASQNYFTSNDATVGTDLGVSVPVNSAGYDAIRLVLSLTEPAPGQLGGTYQVFLDTDDADGVATTQRGGTFNLATLAVPGSESTNASFNLARGPSTSTSFYDDISITQVIPEPGSMALLTSGGVLVLARRRRSK